MIYSYKKLFTPGPNGTVITFKNPGADGIAELGSLDDLWYVNIPDEVEIPDQPPEIEFQPVSLTPELKERMKSELPIFRMISDQQQKMIRDVYPLEEEMYFARIGVGTSMGIYTLMDGEAEALQKFGEHVESVRHWGRSERAKLGL